MEEEAFYCAYLLLNTEGRSFDFSHLYSLLGVIHSGVNGDELMLSFTVLLVTHRVHTGGLSSILI